jgi:acetyl esterase/lipase
MRKLFFDLLRLFITMISCSLYGISVTPGADLPHFPAEKYTTEIRTVQIGGVTRKVSYRSYLHIPYVAKPVDSAYQSLNVWVPDSIDGRAVDATNAPILLEIGVGGYLAVNNSVSHSADEKAGLALSSGYVVVSPGCRGRDNRFPDGTYFGKAPAAIADLKAAVRYIRYNKGILPGNTEWIISVGCSAGGALSVLLGTSGNNHLFDDYLDQIGAADESDKIFAAACYSPITDLEHADMAYEWMFGKIPGRSGIADQNLSEELKNDFVRYQLSLNLDGVNHFGNINANNYQDYLLMFYLIPAANEYLIRLKDDERQKYLAKNKWIAWENNKSSFAFNDYVNHVGRMKGLPAFDDFNKQQPEPSLFGDSHTDARHFTSFSLQYSTRNSDAKPDKEVPGLVNMMNALYFTQNGMGSCAPHWWMRNGSSDNHTSQTVMINLATRLQNLGRDVNVKLFWDGGHCADYDPEGFIEWIGLVTGYRVK